MNSNRLANLALFLVTIGWLFAIYGVMSQVGDPAPDTPIAQIVATRHRSVAVLVVGVICLLSSLWLSGRVFPEAKVRSILSTVAVVGPIVAFMVVLY
ncbi:hypothetical protein EC912_1143 [Luteibacter rhizovicinus]|uniref:Uncharacterized protein n=1 Tax=Luteibacter rhizovicinus TaxID=242606 RepID=A0A4R3YGH3_9GAMM|nr:hypothetical protein EC912_1143 [Luteibacter rhizovicinus]